MSEPGEAKPAEARTARNLLDIPLHDWPGDGMSPPGAEPDGTSLETDWEAGL